MNHKALYQPIRDSGPQTHLQTKKKTNIISKQNIDIAKSVFFIVIFVKVAHN